MTDAPSQGALEDSHESSTLIPKRRRRGRMGDMERLHKIKYMIQSRGSVPMQDFLHELEISKATFKRDLEYLRSRMNAEIVYDRDSGGYRFDQQQQRAAQYPKEVNTREFDDEDVPF